MGLTTDAVQGLRQRLGQLIGASPELGYDQRQILDEHSARKLCSAIVFRAAQRFGQGRDTRDQNVDMLKADTRRSFRTRWREVPLLK